MKLDKRKCDRCGQEYEAKEEKCGEAYKITKRAFIKGYDIDGIIYLDEDYCINCKKSFNDWRNMK